MGSWRENSVGLRAVNTVGLLLLERAWVCFPSLTQQLTATCNSCSRGSNTLFRPLQGQRANRGAGQLSAYSVPVARPSTSHPASCPKGLQPRGRASLPPASDPPSLIHSGFWLCSWLPCALLVTGPHLSSLPLSLMAWSPLLFILSLEPSRCLWLTSPSQLH